MRSAKAAGRRRGTRARRSSRHRPARRTVRARVAAPGTPRSRSTSQGIPSLLPPAHRSFDKGGLACDVPRALARAIALDGGVAGENHLVADDLRAARAGGDAARVADGRAGRIDSAGDVLARAAIELLGGGGRVAVDEEGEA